ncbi:transposase [Streptomyces sp. NPDC017638]|uniref:transposase n=1 Tax=Streptomyces sp. NPDC017638 TaxID=3365004 RepID=UPI00378C45C9
MTGRGDLSDGQWQRLESLLPVSNNRCGRRRDHRQVVSGILHRVRPGCRGSLATALGVEVRTAVEVTSAVDTCSGEGW